MKHTNEQCIFRRKPYLYIKQILQDFNYLNHLNSLFPCDCYLFSWTQKNPLYQNVDIEESEFQYYMEQSPAWTFLGETSYRYNLVSRGTRIFRDPYAKEAFKEYNPSKYYQLCDKNKTPRVGRMYASLLNYLYPVAKPPSSRETYFWKCFNKAFKYVFSHFRKTKPLDVKSAFDSMPKNTSAGFTYLKHGYKQAQKKGDLVKEIFSDYDYIKSKVVKNQPVHDYCMFAMRGHLSDRLKTKTRPVWLVSAGTTLVEMRFFQPFYNQLDEDGSFWKKHLITGKTSLPRLNKYLISNPDHTFYNTDISGWDSYRAAWFHEKVMRNIGKLLDLNYTDRKLFEYCIESAIRTEVLFPNGRVYKKKAGIISGTSGTLLFNSLLNMIAGFTIMNMMKLYNLEPFDEDFVGKIQDPNWLGDDFAFKSVFKIDLEKFSAMMFKYFDVQVNVEKTIIATELDDRKYLGYQLKDGLLFRDNKELFQSLLFTERSFPERGETISISFSRIFSYLLLGGINDFEFVEFFYFYCGFWKDQLSSASNLFHARLENIFKLLKDVWNINIPSFNLETFRKVNLLSLKYCLLYGWDFKFEDILF